MSNVTNLILSFSIGEDERSRIEEVNLFHNNGIPFYLVSADFERKYDKKGNLTKKVWYGGSKCLETPLYIGAINHLDIDGLIEHLKMLEWDKPENVQIILKEQESDKFRIIEIIED